MAEAVLRRSWVERLCHREALGDRLRAGCLHIHADRGQICGCLTPGGSHGPCNTFLPELQLTAVKVPPVYVTCQALKCSILSASPASCSRLGF